MEATKPCPECSAYVRFPTVPGDVLCPGCGTYLMPTRDEGDAAVVTRQWTELHGPTGQVIPYPTIQHPTSRGHS